MGKELVEYLMQSWPAIILLFIGIVAVYLIFRHFTKTSSLINGVLTEEVERLKTDMAGLYIVNGRANSGIVGANEKIAMLEKTIVTFDERMSELTSDAQKLERTLEGMFSQFDKLSSGIAAIGNELSKAGFANRELLNRVESQLREHDVSLLDLQSVVQKMSSTALKA